MFLCMGARTSVRLHENLCNVLIRGRDQGRDASRALLVMLWVIQDAFEEGEEEEEGEGMCVFSGKPKYIIRGTHSSCISVPL